MFILLIFNMFDLIISNVEYIFIISLDIIIDIFNSENLCGLTYLFILFLKKRFIL